jgi:hypothetical protein
VTQIVAQSPVVYQPSMVRKRDGSTVQPYDKGKIERAVRRAWAEVGAAVDETALEKVVAFVGAAVAAETAGVEEIQNAVEVGLMRAKQFDVAKSYILHRQKRAEARTERKSPDHRAISDYVHASKYARWREDLGRREVYTETVARVRDMHLKKFPQVSAEIYEAFAAVERKEVLPAMRHMQFAGEAIENNNLRGFNCSATLTDRPRAFAEAMYLQLCGCGVGYSVQLEHVDKLPVLARVDALNIHHHVVADTIEGWADALDALINSYMSPETAGYGKYVEFSYFVVRDRGVPLKTSGGRAPGHVGLKKALELVRGVLNGAQGRKLRPIEAHRVHCMSFDAVLSGGVRRSAAICLFSPEDGEIMACKSDASWFSREPYLANANNSVVLVRSEDNERAFHRVFGLAKAYGEPGIYFVEDATHAANPCQSGWATVLTPEGIRTFDDISVGSTIWSGKQWTKITKKIATGTKPVFGYHTRAGVFYGTEQHRIMQNGERCEVKDADTIDTCVGGAEGGDFDVQTIMDGMVLGDGTVHHASNDAIWLLIGEDDGDYHASEIAPLIGKSREAAMKNAWEITTTLAWPEVPHTYVRQIPDRFRFGSERMVRSFLRGLYTANGSIVRDRVTLKASGLKVILHAQEMLSSLGIPSYYTVNRPHDVKFLNGVYTCKQSYDLNIISGRRDFCRLIGFIQKDKIERLDTACERASKQRKTSFEIVDVESCGTHQVYDITVAAEEHTYWTGGLLVSNCNEAGLTPVLTVNDTSMTGWSACNLSEINAAKLKTREDFLRATRAATVIGTLQAAYTDFPYIGNTSEQIARRDALLGVGMTGMQDAPQIALDPELQREVAQKVVEWNKEIATKIGINSAARTTLVKPSGTSSLELDYVASGIHPHHARRIIRRVTADELEIPFQAYRAANSHACVRKPDGKWVVEFALEAPTGATVRDDLSALDFVKQVLSTQENWVLPGTGRESEIPGQRHNVSNTITVRPDEWEGLESYLWENKNLVGGVSMLPHDGDVIYPFAPFEAVTTPEQERRWNELITKYTPVNYAALTELQDDTAPTGEAACAGGACTIT